MTRGRPFEPGNQFGRGRPKGSLNKSTLLVRELLAEHSSAILRKALSMALQGNVPLLRLFVSLIVPKPKDFPTKFGRLPMGTTKELNATFDATIKKMAAGKISVTQATEISNLMENRRKLIETTEIDNRLNRLELIEQHVT